MSTNFGIDYDKRIFNDYSAFLAFFKKNKSRVKHIKINPPKLNGAGYGSVEVELKPTSQYHHEFVV